MNKTLNNSESKDKNLTTMNSDHENIATEPILINN